MGAAIGKDFLRSWGAAALTVVAVAVAAWAQYRYQLPLLAKDRETHWIVISIVAAAVAAVTPLVDAQVRRGKRRSYEQKLRAARVEQVVSINDALDPLVERFGKLVIMTDPAARPAAVNSLIVQALNSIAQVIGPDRTRANYFQAQTAIAPAQLVCKESAGRHTGPETVFWEDRPDGAWVFGLLKRDAPHFCESVKDTPPPGWDASRKRSYETFISVPASVGAEAVGMLTVDAPLKGDLKEQDIPLIRVIGTIIAASVRIAEEPGGDST